MKIGISFNYDKDNIQENISKLLLVPEIKKCIDDHFWEYYIEVSTLEEFDTVLERINKAFEYDVDFIITPDRLEIFIQFTNDN